MLMVAMVATTGTIYAQSAQYVGDAIRFSNSNYGSSARFKAMGNANVGVGGDMSSLGGNPAGLGLFTRSEFSLTPELNMAGSKSNYLGEANKGNETKMNLNHIGVVWYNPSFRPQGQDTKKGLLSTVVGIGYNRNNDFNQHYTYGGNNTANSMRNYFAELANSSKDGSGTIPRNSLEDMAFNSYLINYDIGGKGMYSADAPIANKQLKNETTSGSTSELDFSGALNISNQVYIGASIGVVNVRYISNSEYLETGTVNPYDNTPPAGQLPGFTGTENYRLSYVQSQETKGSGINARLGVIFRPVSNFRIGATLQTPTWLSIDDNYAEVLNNNLTGGTNTFNSNNKPNSYPFSYNLRTPLKGSLGASYVFGGQALLSADIDFIDYSSTRFSDIDGGPESETIRANNAGIREMYTSAINYRVGGEYKIQDLSVRAGFGINGSPIKEDDDKLFETKYYSAGLGYRFNEYYVDLAYQRVESQNRMSSYALNDNTQPVANIKNGNNNVFLTFGLRF